MIKDFPFYEKFRIMNMFFELQGNNSNNNILLTNSSQKQMMLP